MRGRCLPRGPRHRWMTGYATGSSPKRAGNPLALLELPRSAAAGASWPAGSSCPRCSSVPRTAIEESFRRRSSSLPAETQLLLLVAAAEPTGDVALLWRAAAHLGIDAEAAAPAEAAGLLEIDTRVRFRHPLVRSAVYRAADARRTGVACTGALAACHRPAGRPRPARLAPRAGGAGHRRGGRGGAGAFGRPGACPRRARPPRPRSLQRAAELTPEPADRARDGRWKPPTPSTRPARPKPPWSC